MGDFVANRGIHPLAPDALGLILKPTSSRVLLVSVSESGSQKYCPNSLTILSTKSTISQKFKIGKFIFVLKDALCSETYEKTIFNLRYSRFCTQNS